ncbi:MAG: hypothetical protein H6550_01610 [Chitinophagales bacterium]|nr:hypothetical protein [Chitinophagales bacterium]
MKLITTTLLAALLCGSLYAQSFSAGLRSGIGKTLDVAKINEGTINNTWDKELFLRYETKGRFAFEAGATQYIFTRNNSDSYVNTIICFPADDYYYKYERVSQFNKYNVIDFGLSAQLDLTCKGMQQCPVLKNMRSFVGVYGSMGYAYTTTTYTDRSYADGMEVNRILEDKYPYNVTLGLNHTLKYTINKMYITSVVAYGIQPGSFSYMYWAGDPTPNSKLSLRLGAGYNF